MAMGTATFDFSGAKVLVTGGTSGIGLATARGFAAAGAQVTITGTRQAAGDYDDDLAIFEYRQMLTTDNAQIKATAAALDGLDVLVNNAGNIRVPGPDDDVVEVFEEMVRTHLLSAHNLTQACLEQLAGSALPGGASVVSIASLTSFLSNPFSPGYGAGKAGMVQLARTQAAIWADRGIRCNCVAAGNIHTRMTDAMVAMPELSESMLARTPMKRWGQPAEIADAVMYLSSDRASFVTGVTLVVDGGFLYNM